MRYPLLLVLTIGCTTGDPDAGESEEVAMVTTCPTGQWCVESVPTTGRVAGVWAVTAEDVFAVGDTGTILRRNNDAWTAMTSGVTTNLRGVWASSSSDVWAVGGAGTIVHFDGSQWSAVSGGGTADLIGVWGSSATDVWMCG